MKKFVIKGFVFNREKHPIVRNEPAHDTIEGCEFLDDAIRMHDLPIMYTEVSVAAGCPENLL